MQALGCFEMSKFPHNTLQCVCCRNHERRIKEETKQNKTRTEGLLHGPCACEVCARVTEQKERGEESEIILRTYFNILTKTQTIFYKHHESGPPPVSPGPCGHRALIPNVFRFSIPAPTLLSSWSLAQGPSNLSIP